MYFNNIIKIKYESFSLYLDQANCKMCTEEYSLKNTSKEVASGTLTFVDVSFFQFIVECNSNVKLGVLNEAASRKYYGNIKVAQTVNER